MLAYLAAEVEVLAGLDRSRRRVQDCFDAIETFDRASTDVAENDSAEWVAINLGQGFSIHFPGEKNLVGLNFRPRD